MSYPMLKEKHKVINKQNYITSINCFRYKLLILNIKNQFTQRAPELLQLTTREMLNITQSDRGRLIDPSYIETSASHVKRQDNGLTGFWEVKVATLLNCHNKNNFHQTISNVVTYAYIEVATFGKKKLFATFN